MAPSSLMPPVVVRGEPSSGGWSVYLLRCGDGSLYCGVTTDLRRRIEQHSAGSGARYTRGRGPLTLVYQETQPSSSLALKREAAIKRLTRTQKEALIQGAGQPPIPEKIVESRQVRRTKPAAASTAD